MDRRALVRKPLIKPSPLNLYQNIESGRRVLNKHTLWISHVRNGEQEDHAFVFGPLPADEFRALGRELFAARPFEVTLESESARSVEEALKAGGWTCVEEEIGMVLTAILEIPPTPESLRIETVRDERTYADYMAVVPGNRQWVPNLEAAIDPRVGLFVGYADSRPVATSRLTCFGEVAEISAVQTLAPYRRRGFGRAMSWAAIADAQHRGCTTFTLTATESGYPLYLDMGFEEVCTFRTYTLSYDFTLISA